VSALRGGDIKTKHDMPIIVEGKYGGKLVQYEKGESGNPNGRPKGTISKKPKLKKLIKDLAAIMDTLSEREKNLAYQLYQIVEEDIRLSNISSSVSHLYFIESDFGIKIGISKKVDDRLRTIKRYAQSAKILKLIKYAGNFELNIHKKFDHINIKNNHIIGIEWFSKTNDLLDFIDEIDEVNDLHRYFNPKGSGQLLMF
jgi:hypothetical protein